MGRERILTRNLVPQQGQCMPSQSTNNAHSVQRFPPPRYVLLPLGA